MQPIYQEICLSIFFSRKLKIRLQDGEVKIVHPHLILKRLQGGNQILKTKLDDEECLDIEIETITKASLLKDNFAINSKCLVYDFQEYEIVYPKMEDWFTPIEAKNYLP